MLTSPQAIVQFVRGYGTRYSPAGYWPGSKAAGDKPTGLLVDEGKWAWNSVTDESSTGNVNVTQGGTQNRLAGYGFMLIYCDAQLSQDVYFLGRMYREEPGGT